MQKNRYINVALQINTIPLLVTMNRNIKKPLVKLIFNEITNKTSVNIILYVNKY